MIPRIAAGPVRLLEAGIEYLLVILLGTLVLIVNVEVFSRFLIGGSITWVLEVSRICFIWVVFLGAGLAVRRSGYTAIELISKRLPPWWSRWFTSATILSFGCVFAYLGWLFVYDSGSQTYVLTGIPTTVTDVAPIVFGALCVTFALANLFVKEAAATEDLSHKEYLMG